MFKKLVNTLGVFLNHLSNAAIEYPHSKHELGPRDAGSFTDLLKIISRGQNVLTIIVSKPIHWDSGFFRKSKERRPVGRLEMQCVEKLVFHS
mgnify:CR=1 FL=1